ncbi:MAG: hypothetical protein K0Q71_3782, partial [Thermomicrobiales bacterium]|nr:hypothetical protein [Thermomicrobiales bacterium]
MLVAALARFGFAPACASTGRTTGRQLPTDADELAAAFRGGIARLANAVANTTLAVASLSRNLFHPRPVG